MQKYLNVPKLPLRGHYTSEAQHERVTFLENFCSINLDFLRETNLQPSELKGNIESYIGTIQLPLGIVGPVFLTGIEEIMYPYSIEVIFCASDFFTLLGLP